MKRSDPINEEYYSQKLTMAKPSGISTTLLIVYVNVALYATCFQMQRPLEPFLVEKLNLGGDSADEYGKLQSFFSIVQTLGSFVSGRFLDRFGAKGGFIISFLSSAACYALLSQATTLRILYISKIPTVFQAGFLCAQVAASQATTDGAERVQALGRLTMSYTIGSVIGPTIGGLLGASGDYYLGAKLAVAGSLLSVLLTLLMPSGNSSTNVPSSKLPVSPSANPAITGTTDILMATNNDEKKSCADISESSPASAGAGGGDANGIPSIRHVISIVWLFLSAKVITSVANAMAAAAFPLILKDIYGMDEKQLGFSMSFMSACNAIVNGLFLGPIVMLAGNNLGVVISICIGSMAAISALQALLALPGVPSLLPALPTADMYEYLLLSFVLSMFQYVLSTTITGESTARVGPRAKGTLLGLEHSLFAAARVVAPTTGVHLLKSGGTPLVSGACSVVFAGVYVLWQCCAGENGGGAARKKSAYGATDERKEK